MKLHYSILSLCLKKVRGGAEGESKLVELLNDLDDSPFNPDKADIFLGIRQREIGTIGLFMERDGRPENGIVVDEDSSALANECRMRFKFNLEFVLPVLPKSDIMESYLNNSMQDESDKWFNHPTQTRKSSSKYRKFVEFYDLNNGNPNVCFIVVLKELENEQDAKIMLVDSDANILTDNLKIPPKIVPYGDIKVSHDTIIYNVDYLDIIMTHIEVQYTEILPSNEDNSTDTIFQSFSKLVPLNQTGKTLVNITDLTPGIYELTQRFISIINDTQWAVGPQSDPLTIETSPMAPPSGLSVENKGETTVSLAWNSPVFIAPGTIVEYRTFVYHDSCMGNSIQERTWRDTIIKQTTTPPPPFNFLKLLP